MRLVEKIFRWCTVASSKWIQSNLFSTIYFRFSTQIVIFKPLSYCLEEIIGFDVNASFASRPVSRLIKPSDIIKKI